MQFDHLNRREIISLLSGATVAWPLTARAEQGKRVRRVGVLMNYASDDAEHTILDVIGCLLANRCQVEKLLFYG